jgi:hypothetical protein
MITLLRDRLATYASDSYSHGLLHRSQEALSFPGVQVAPDLRLYRRKAYKFVGSLFASVIGALRRDPRFRNLPVFELEMLADTHANAERQLVGELKDRVHLDDIGEDLWETPAQLNEKASHEDSMIEQLGE